MTETDPTTDAFDRDDVRSASRIAIAALALVGVLYLFTLLPGVDRLVPLTPITFAAVASAVVTAAVVALLLYAAPRVASLTRATLHRTDAGERVERIAENGGALAYWLVALAAVLVAHSGFAGAIVPLLDGFAWAYDAAFLVVSFVPLVFVVARLTVTVDPLSELVADRVTGDESSEDGDADEPRQDGDDGLADADATASEAAASTSDADGPLDADGSPEATDESDRAEAREDRAEEREDRADARGRRAEDRWNAGDGASSTAEPDERG